MLLACIDIDIDIDDDVDIVVSGRRFDIDGDHTAAEGHWKRTSFHSLTESRSPRSQVRE